MSTVTPRTLVLFQFIESSSKEIQLYVIGKECTVSLMGGSRLCINIYKNKTARMRMCNREQKYREPDS